METLSNGFLKKDFLILIIGQIISIFGNSCLRFSIPLYLLTTSSSSIAFSLNLAISVLPTIFFSPLNGLIADMFSKRKTMIYLDLFTCFITLLAILTLKSNQEFVLLTGFTFLLSSIQAIYQPTVLSSIPLLMQKKDIGKANAIVNQVQSLSNIIGPALGGFFFNYFGIQFILIVAAFSFLFSAFVEVFMKIPELKVEKDTSLLHRIKQDTIDCFDYFKRKKILLKIAILVALFNLFFESMLIIGLPQIILNYLKLNSTFYGLVQSAQSFGALLGGLLLTLFFNRFKMNRSYLLFASTVIILLPIPFILYLEIASIPSAMIICICCFFFMISSTIFSIMMISFIQSMTPNVLMGKIISYVYALTACARPLGQVMYGYLFEKYFTHTVLILLVTIFINIFISLYAKKILSPV
ncbi:MFS transporter [Enterococcus raffinosus]|uniref:MFS transporter n=1 Tax=Enterococcus raffinosus TaxID=71452 RepID=UPI001C11CC44|nr:MFS transporter [Enterococcus raffinosus]MBU5363056.1 MFS transporter [Enterococcus raffinosus]